MSADPEREDDVPVREREADAPSHDNITDPRCDLCGAPMKEWHCRIICTSCGYQRDCSDP
ncbi:MAG TPA: hypothetical protein VK928_03615 [Longimicrobiales bacterium]|nr:hypothetical protein [Longimicrobiales bacterium]